MSQSALNSCESLTIKGVLQEVVRKKSGRITKLRLKTQKGVREIKASKYLRVRKDYQPVVGDEVQLKALKKIKAGRVKLKAFELAFEKAGRRDKSKGCPLREIAICQSSGCRKRGAEKLKAKLEQGLAQSDSNRVRLTTSKCLGKCKAGPAVKVKPSGKVYARLDPKTAMSLLG